MIHKGEILRKLIRDKRSTVGKVAEHLGLNRSYLSTLLNDPNLKEDFIERACEFLGVDKDQYFSENPLPPAGSLMEKYVRAIERLNELQAENIILVKENASLKSKLDTYEHQYGPLDES